MKLNKTRFPGVYYRESTDGQSGRFKKCFYIKYYIGRKQHEERVGWSHEGYTAELANRLRNERIHAIRHGNALPEMRKKVTFADAAEEYLKTKKSKKSWSDDRDRLEKKVLPFFGDELLNNITTPMVQSFVDRLRGETSRLGRPYAAQSIIHFVNVVRAVFNKAIQHELYHGTNPADFRKLDLPIIDNERIEFLHDDELERLMPVLDAQEDVTGANIVRFALLTGMRKGEILGLQWDSVNLKTGDLVIRKAKSGRDEKIQISSETIKLLKKQRELTGFSDYVFPGRSGDRRKCIYGLFGNIKKEAEIRPHVRFHDLRHTFGTRLVNAGVDLYTVSKLMTHKDLTMTKRYAHIVSKTLRDAADVMGNILSSFNQPHPDERAE